MFRFTALTLNHHDQEYSYKFHPGINFFRGANNTGKTVFYDFIDYLLGSSRDLSKKEWFIDSLSSATLSVETSVQLCHFRRTLSPDTNYFRYDDEDWGEPLGLYEYKAKLDNVLCPDPELLADLRRFAEEALTYRTYTAFSFMGEKSFGNLTDFLDKGSDPKYSYKLATILNHFFNQDLAEISRLQNELDSLLARLETMERSVATNQAIIDRVNESLELIGVGKVFTGANVKTVLEELERIRAANIPKAEGSLTRDTAKLEVLLSNMDEQIKVHEAARRNLVSFETEANQRKRYVEELERLVASNPGYGYLTSPILEVLGQLDKSISFNRYLAENPAIDLLKQQRQKVRSELLRQDSRHKVYTQPAKTQAMGTIDTLLRNGFAEVKDNRSELKKRIKELREQIRTLQQYDSKDRIEEVSKLTTDYYRVGADYSPLVQADFQRSGFRVRYVKRGNSLQPQASVVGTDEAANLDLGSLARHTLIQLSGYLALLTAFIANGRYPLVPILVIDHISKPFDSVSRLAIGPLLERFLTTNGVESVQVFLFDDKTPSDLGLENLAYEELAGAEKTGFNPFFTKIPDATTGGNSL